MVVPFLDEEPEPTAGEEDLGVDGMMLVDTTTTTLAEDPVADADLDPAPTGTVDALKMAAELEEAAQSLTVTKTVFSELAGLAEEVATTAGALEME